MNLSQSKEILRVSLHPDWSQQSEIRLAGSDPVQEAGLWGIILADVIRHLSKAVQEHSEPPMPERKFREAVLAEVRKELLRADPKDMNGGFLRGGPAG
jgi:hypothetical protein